MKVKFTSTDPVNFGDVPVKQGDVLDLPEAQAKEALATKRFVLVDSEKPKTKTKKKTVEKTEEN